MNDRTAPHHCPISLTPGEVAIPLGSTALLADPAHRPAGRTDRVRYTLRLSVLSLRQVNGFFTFDDHMEKTSEFDDHLVIDLDPDTNPAHPEAFAAWTSTIGEPLRRFRHPGPPLTDDREIEGVWVGTVPLPTPGRDVLGPNAAVRLTVRPRLNRQG
jgi:hypothetical protein